MNKSTLRNLLIVLFALVAIVLGLELAQDRPSTASGDLLYPQLKSQINEVENVIVESPGEPPVNIVAEDGAWVVVERGRYPASVGKIREVLLAVADARILEQKTANPDRYAALGVRDPDAEGSEGVRLTIRGGEADYALIVGKLNQGSNRYVRVADDSQSLLIDKDPALPETAGGWLRNELLNVPGSEVKAAEIRHADGERIRIAKSTAEDNDFSVVDIPDDRELSYATVANGIGSVLANLTLEDVRPDAGGEAASVALFDTFDGRRITVSVFREADDAWVAIDASASPLAPSDADETAADVGQETEALGDDAGAGAAEALGTLNERTSGWQYKLPDFKTNQLTRRWEDILKTEDDSP